MDQRLQLHHLHLSHPRMSLRRSRRNTLFRLTSLQASRSKRQPWICCVHSLFQYLHTGLDLIPSDYQHNFPALLGSWLVYLFRSFHLSSARRVRPTPKATTS